MEQLKRKTRKMQGDFGPALFPTTVGLMFFPPTPYWEEISGVLGLSCLDVHLFAVPPLTGIWLWAFFFCWALEK